MTQEEFEEALDAAFDYTDQGYSPPTLLFGSVRARDEWISSIYLTPETSPEND